MPAEKTVIRQVQFELGRAELDIHSFRNPCRYRSCTVSSGFHSRKPGRFECGDQGRGESSAISAGSQGNQFDGRDCSRKQHNYRSFSPRPVAPPVSTDSQTVTIPGTHVNSSGPDARLGRRGLQRSRGRNGQAQPVRNEKFYLLDKDLESILFEADLEPIDGQSLANSFGLAMTFPDRYADFRRQALAAIRPHIKHSATSDAEGKAAFGNIDPDSYYLFGVTRGDRGFALWSSPVSIRAGQNVLELSPQPLTDVG